MPDDNNENGHSIEYDISYASSKSEMMREGKGRKTIKRELESNLPQIGLAEHKQR